MSTNRGPGVEFFSAFDGKRRDSNSRTLWTRRKDLLSKKVLRNPDLEVNTVPHISDTTSIRMIVYIYPQFLVSVNMESFHIAQTIDKKKKDNSNFRGIRKEEKN